MSALLIPRWMLPVAALLPLDAGGLPPLSNLDALNLVRTAAPLLSQQESQFVRIIARHETTYARGWKDNKDIPGAVGDPTESHNMGAITAHPAWVSAGKPFFTYMDGLAVKEARKFKVYQDDGFGIRDLARELFVRRAGIKEALSKGDGLRAVTIMKETRYFEAPLDSYITAVKRNYEVILASTKEPRLLRFDPEASTTVMPNTGSSGVLELAVVVGAMWAAGKWL